MPFLIGLLAGFGTWLTLGVMIFGSSFLVLGTTLKLTIGTKISNTNLDYLKIFPLVLEFEAKTAKSSFCTVDSGFVEVALSH